MKDNPEITFTAYFDGVPIFSSGDGWLHPLFELEEFLKPLGIDTSRVFVTDTIVGKAAAILLVRLGIRDVFAGILSDPAREYFESHNVAYAFGTKVERIECKTEELLGDVDDSGKAYAILEERAGRNG